MTSTGPGHRDPRIVRITLEGYDTAQSALSRAASSNLSQNVPRVWIFGHLVFHNVQYDYSEFQAGLESRFFRHVHSRDMGYEADSEAICDLKSLPPKKPPHLPPVVEDNMSTESRSSGSPVVSVLPDGVIHLSIEKADGVEDSDVSSSGKEDTETVDYETELTFKWTLTDLIRQMMFVSGETAEPSIESTTLIEDITRQQVIEIVSLFLSFFLSFSLI
jgi:hypothetical protein